MESKRWEAAESSCRTLPCTVAEDTGRDSVKTPEPSGEVRGMTKAERVTDLFQWGVIAEEKVACDLHASSLDPRPRRESGVSLQKLIDTSCAEANVGGEAAQRLRLIERAVIQPSKHVSQCLFLTAR